MSEDTHLVTFRTVFPTETKDQERHDVRARKVKPRAIGRREMRTFIEQTLEDLERAQCEFRFCPGPDKPTVHMATCFICYRVKRTRVMLAWLNDPA